MVEIKDFTLPQKIGRGDKKWGTRAPWSLGADNHDA